MHRFWERFTAWLPAIALYTGITYLSGQSGLPGPTGPVFDFIWFKSAHVLVYSALTVFIFIGWIKTVQGFTLRFSLTWFSVMILASLDELHQSFVPGRESSVRDIFIDLVAAAAVLWMIRRYNQNQSSRSQIQSGTDASGM